MSIDNNICLVDRIINKLKTRGKYLPIFRSGEFPSLVMIKDIQNSTAERSKINIEYTGDKGNAIKVLNTYMQTVLYMNTKYQSKKENEAITFLSKEVSSIKKQLEISEEKLLQENSEINLNEVSTNRNLYNALVQRLKEVRVRTGQSSNVMNQVSITQNAKIVTDSSSLLSIR